MHRVPEQSPLSPTGENFLVEATTKDPLYCLPVNDADLRFVKVRGGNAVDSTVFFPEGVWSVEGSGDGGRKKKSNSESSPSPYPPEKSKIAV